MEQITADTLRYHLYFCIWIGQATVAVLMAMSFFKALEWFNKTADKVLKK